MQLVSVAVPFELYRPPPELPAELPLTVQLVSVVVPPPVWPRRRRSPEAELPLTVQLVSVVVPSELNRPPPLVGGVAADGAVGQRGRAGRVVQAAAVGAGGVAADGAVGQRGRAAQVVTGRRRCQRRSCR